MVKKLLNSLLTPRSKIKQINSSRITGLQLPEHPNTTIELKRTHRKKSVAFRVANNQVKILAPKRLALYRIQQLLQKRADWIGSQLSYQASLPEELPRQFGVGADQSINYLGKRYRLNITTSTDKARTVQLRAGIVRVILPNGQQSHEESHDEIKAALGSWYQQRAEERLPAIVAQLSTKIGVSYGEIQIRHFKSRWGSCRADGKLQFNWRLMMAPPEVIKYVVVHELCHRIHLNHSSAFWDEVGKYMPDFRQHRKWLKIEGLQLTL